MEKNEPTRVLSKVPASDIEIITESPFIFSVMGEMFEIEPFCFRKYLQIEKMFKQSIISLLYYTAGWDIDLAKLLDINEQGRKAIRHAVAFTKIISKSCYPSEPQKYIQFKRRIKKILNNHNWKYWNHPTYWVGSLADWLEVHLKMGQLLELASYIVRYMAEKKTILYHLLQGQGIGNLTAERPISLVSTVKQLMRAALDPGSRQSLTTRH